MLAGTKQNLWKELVDGATVEELFWMNGYLSGLLSLNKRNQVQTETASPVVSKITIAYGTETGNAKGLATRLAAVAKKKGVITKLLSLEQYKAEDLKKGGFLIIVISTQGDGEPPVAAKKFYDYLHSLDSGLGDLSYAILALGDSSYPLFCKTGEDIDLQLHKAGANRFAQLQKCDTDYEADANQWFEQALQNLNQQQTGSAQTAVTASKTATGKKHYKGIISQSINLNDQGSSKETYHIEIEADDLVYEPGDSLGILPVNNESQVRDILSLTDVPADKVVSYKNESCSIFDLLKNELNISCLPERTVKKYAEIIRQEIPATKIALSDLLKIYPVQDAEQFEEVIKILEPLTPRLYSISSAPSAHDGEIHIIVSRNTFNINTEKRFGLCSDYLSHFKEEQEISFYIHPNKLFRLPPEEDRDVIMIGPGTGIAPFRSFLAEREARGSEGRNWLFFGDQHFTSDFLYQTEIQTWHETGVLTHINVAFSRDQKEKIYVQHKIWEHGATFYEWLSSGAIIYICGAKDPMSIDVENTIKKVIQTYGAKTEEEAQQFLEEMKETGRYLKDVY